MEGATEPIAAPPSELPEFRGPPPPRHGGLLTLLRFLRRQGMLNVKYGRLVARLWLWKLRLGKRLRLDGLAFVGPRCSLEVRKGATLELGRWSWVGHGCKIRSHEGTISIGAKSVLGQECTISSFQHVSIGRTGQRGGGGSARARVAHARGAQPDALRVVGQAMR